jgi:glycosyltransferase involved in cell wall biosynthesis
MEQRPTAERIRNDALVSIVVPVYNTKEYLSRCVGSILAQTHRNLELILVDDGSTDGSGALCDAYAGRDARVRVLHTGNGGVSAARNRGIDAAKGDYIGFADSDDWAEPDWIERLLAPFSDDPGLSVSVCNWYVHRDGETEPGTARGRGRLSPKEALSEALDHSRGFHGYLWNKLFCADLFRTEPRLRLDTDVSVCEDLLLCVGIFASGASAYDGGEPLYHYLYRESGALRTMDEKRMSEFSARERIAERLSDDAPLYHAAELAHVKAALNLLAIAKDRETTSALKRRIDARLPMLLHASDLNRSERAKLMLRRAFPKLSMRLFTAVRRGARRNS